MLNQYVFVIQTIFEKFLYIFQPFYQRPSHFLIPI